MSETDAIDREAMHRLAELAAAEQAGQLLPAELSLGPFTAFSLISLIQVACRHPEMPDTMLRATRRITDQLEPLFGGVIAEVIQRGWDSACDIGPWAQ